MFNYTFNSIKDYLKAGRELPPHLFLRKTFNSIKDYLLKNCQAKHIKTANFQFHQGLSGCTHLNKNKYLKTFNSIKDYLLLPLTLNYCLTCSFNSIKDYQYLFCGKSGEGGVTLSIPSRIILQQELGNAIKLHTTFQFHQGLSLLILSP